MKRQSRRRIIVKLMLERTRSGAVVVVGIGLGQKASNADVPTPASDQEMRDCKKVSMSK